jgi:hypothetical protein
MNRRNILQLGALSCIGINNTNYSMLIADDNIATEAKAKSVIYIYLPGGFSTQETFDPKPFAPAEYRGPLSSIDTSITGIKFSELLKDTAKIADKITVIRSMNHNEAAHERGTHNMFTGWRPSPAIQYPSIGSIVGHELGGKNNLPPYITVPNVPNEFAGAGYLSHSYSSFSLGGNPEDPNFKVRDLRLPEGISIQRFDKRKKMLEVVNKNFDATQKSDALVAMNSFYENAFELMDSNAAIEAFDLSLEKDETKETYGKNSAGMRMLLSRRLVEAGVRFITMTYGGWDHHDNIATNMQTQLPPFDKAFSSLILDLESRGLLESTLVVVGTEFGRTPKINPTAGRDHWPKLYSGIMAGGGIKSGIVYGSSNDTATDPLDNPVSVEDWASTIYTLLGINPEKHIMAPGNRPVKIVDGGKPILEIIV